MLREVWLGLRYWFWLRKNKLIVSSLKPVTGLSCVVILFIPGFFKTSNCNLSLSPWWCGWWKHTHHSNKYTHTNTQIQTHMYKHSYSTAPWCILFPTLPCSVWELYSLLSAALCMEINLPARRLSPSYSKLMSSQITRQPYSLSPRELGSLQASGVKSGKKYTKTMNRGEK